MKNLLKLASIFLVFISVVSCSKEDDKVLEPSIVGKWEFAKQVSYDNSNKEVITGYIHRCSSQKDFIQFEFNGVYNSSISSSNCISETETRTYVYENNLVRLYNGNDLISYRIQVLSLSANELKIKYVNSGAQKSDVTTYILIRK